MGWLLKVTSNVESVIPQRCIILSPDHISSKRRCQKLFSQSIHLFSGEDPVMTWTFPVSGSLCSAGGLRTSINQIHLGAVRMATGCWLSVVSADRNPRRTESHLCQHLVSCTSNTRICMHLKREMSINTDGRVKMSRPWFIYIKKKNNKPLLEAT